MEFEEIQKTWKQQATPDQQISNMETTIVKKAAKADRTVQKNESGLILIFSFTGIVLLTDAVADREGWQDYFKAFLILLLPLSIYVMRRKRLKQLGNYDQSILGIAQSALTNMKNLMFLAYSVCALIVSNMLYEVYEATLGEGWADENILIELFLFGLIFLQTRKLKEVFKVVRKLSSQL